MMARRSFRYDPVSDRFVEITREAAPDAPYVRDDISPFVSPIDGSVVSSQSALRDHMGRHGVVHYDEVKNQGPKKDRYQEQRERRALRERLWEYTDRAIRTGKAT
jgi:hypothetical protein